jgi:selenocysteine-specific elongation factor
MILGTAGHIDHGKTSLVKALTGTDTDRLKEEQRRGITIELGFAHLTLDDGTPAGLVDVPGHERFVKAMAAGAGGVDLVILVVAADEGVMPQTREHLDIARLLGVEAGLVALTKCDLVDEELRELAIADVEELLAGTFMEGCPIVPVSSSTGAGLDELTRAVMDVAAQVAVRQAVGLFRMPIDRVFTVKGVGTVVTGTTLAGEVRVDDELEVVPAGRRGRVRGIEVHGEAVGSCRAGHRAALNLAGLEKGEIERGQVLAAPGSLPTTFMLDAEVELLPTASPLRRGSEVMLHTGTLELTAKLFPLDAESVAPGAKALAQLRLREEIPIAAGDRLILRSSTGEHTIGGGLVLDAHPTKHRRKRQEAAEQLDKLRDADLTAALLHEVSKAPLGLEAAVAQQRLYLSDEQLQESLAALLRSDVGLDVQQVGQQRYLTLRANRERIAAGVHQALKTFRQANPLVATGLSAKALSKAVDKSGKGVPVEVLAPVLEAEAAAGRLVGVEGTYAIPKEEVKLGVRDRQAVEILLQHLNATSQPDQPEELLGLLPVDKKRLRHLLDYLVEDGQLALAGNLYFGAEQVARARRKLLEHFKTQPTVTISEFRQLVHSTRKYAVPLIQLFDNEGMLVRDGDDRRLNPDWEGTGN